MKARTKKRSLFFDLKNTHIHQNQIFVRFVFDINYEIFFCVWLARKNSSSPTTTNANLFINYERKGILSTQQ